MVSKHLKKSNAACFYTPMVLKLLIIVQMWKQHEEGNLIAIILTPHLLKLIKYWQFYGASKVESTHFHCCSKSYWPYWLAQYYGRLFEPLITSCVDFLRNSILLISQCMEMNRWLSLHFICIPQLPNLDQYYHASAFLHQAYQ